MHTIEKIKEDSVESNYRCPVCKNCFVPNDLVVRCLYRDYITHTRCWHACGGSCPFCLHGKTADDITPPGIFQNVEKQLDDLEKLFQEGQIDEIELISQAEKLTLVLDNGTTWRLDLTGEWFVFQSQGWSRESPGRVYSSGIKPAEASQTLPNIITATSAVVTLITAIIAIFTGITVTPLVGISVFLSALSVVGVVIFSYLIVIKDNVGSFFINGLGNEHIVKKHRYSKKVRIISFLGIVICILMLLGALVAGIQSAQNTNGNSQTSSTNTHIIITGPPTYQATSITITPYPYLYKTG